MTANRPRTAPADDPRALHRTLTAALHRCVIVDCETTGLDPRSDSIIEVAALRVRDGRPVALFHRLVDPHRPVPAPVTALTGLRREDLAGAPADHEMMADLLPFLRNDTVVGHHVAFDIGFLDAVSPAGEHPGGAGYGGPAGWDGARTATDSLCTAESARQLIPRSRVQRYRLHRLSEALGLEHRPDHRTIEDVLTTLDLLRALHDIAAEPSTGPTVNVTETP